MGGIALGQQGGWHGGSWREDPWLLMVDLVAAAQFLLQVAESQREGNGTESWKELMCCAWECRGGRGSLGLTCGPKFRGSLLENKMMKI